MRKASIKVIALMIAVVAAGAFFYLYQTGGLWFTPRIFPDVAQLEKDLGAVTEKAQTALKTAVGQVPQKISAPAPLRAVNKTTGAALTNVGVISLTNLERAKNGVAPLAENSRLDSAAFMKARDMLKYQYFDHVSPSGMTLSDLDRAAGYEYISVGENLAMGNFKDNADLVRAWMDSPGHRANILEGHFVEIGVAVIQGIYEGQTVWKAVQEFGRPLSLCASPDSSLASQIQANNAELERLSAEISAKKQEIENGSYASRAEYNQAVAEYNALVNEYNALHEQNNTIIVGYNKGVDAFNVCVKL